MNIQFTWQGRGIVVTRQGFLFIALLRSASTGRPVLGWYTGGNRHHIWGIK